MSENPEITEARENLKEKHEESERLHAELDMSLDIHKLWPEAFEGEQSAVTVLNGNPQSPATMTLEITRSDGQTRSFALKDVPEKLLNFHVNKVDEPARFLLQQYVKRLHRRGKSNGTV